MALNWEYPWQPFEDKGPQPNEVFGGETAQTRRLDTLLPIDPQTGAVTSEALDVYLSAMMLMTERNAQPLSLLHLCVDDNLNGSFLGVEASTLIGRAMARCMRQETRAHDVVGRAPENSAQGVPAFLLVCPLMSEEAAARLAERLRQMMTTDGACHSRSWLSISVGITGMALDTPDTAALIGRALAATRHAHRNGGNRVWRHSDTFRQLIEETRDDTAE